MVRAIPVFHFGSLEGLCHLIGSFAGYREIC